MEKVVKVTALAIIMCFSTSAAATSVWLDSVNVIPGQPLDTDLITFNISGQASGSPSEVEYDVFSQNGTSLQLDLYVNIGVFAAISDWDHSKQIQPLAANDYTLEVRAFDYQLDTLQDTYTVDFTVTPEPATLVLLTLGLPLLRAFSRRKR